MSLLELAKTEQRARQDSRQDFGEQQHLRLVDLDAPFSEVEPGEIVRELLASVERSFEQRDFAPELLAAAGLIARPVDIALSR